MMNVKKYFFLSFLGLIFFGLSLEGVDAQDNSVKFGSHKVGFRYTYLLDENRNWEPFPFKSEETPRSKKRPIRVAVWYPAEPAKEKRMLFKNYINPKAPDDYFGKLNKIMNVYDMWSYNGMFKKDKSVMNRLLDFETNVYFNARAKKGKYPLVLYCSGWFSRSPDNTLLAEFLASHGYVVATIPQLGTGSTIFDFKITKDRVMTQVLDLQFALNTALKMENVDPKRIGSVGFSVGGIVSLWLSQMDKRVSAVVGLDGSYVFEDSMELVKENVAVKRSGFPILSFYRGHEKQKGNVNLSFIKSLKWANRFVVGMPKATHGEFYDEPHLLQQMKFQPWPRLELNSHEEALAIHYTTINITKLFFDELFLDEANMKQIGKNIATQSQKKGLVYEQYLQMN